MADIATNIINSVGTLNYTATNAEPILEPLFRAADVERFFTVQDNVSGTHKLPVIGALRKITKKYAGCGLTVTGDGVALSDREIAPIRMESHLEHCADVFDDSIFAAAKKKGYANNDVTGTQIEDIIQQLVSNATKEDYRRQLFFNDTALTGNADYNAYDGVWAKLKEGVTDTIVNRYTVTNNGALTDGESLTILDGLIAAATPVLKQVPKSQAEILVTGTIFDNLLSYKTGTGRELESTFQLLENGNGDMTEFETTKYKGYTIVAMREWDTWIEDLEQTDIHRAIFWVPSNHFIATDMASAKNQVKIWYSDDDDLTKTLVRYTVDYQFALGAMVAVAYAEPLP